MPLYFAYGSNMNVAAMAVRCPAAKPVGAARLARHRFVIMQEGFASIARDPRGVVHGVLWTLTFGDLRRLDAYEEVARGLYTKVEQPVIKASGGSSRALVYVGRSGAGGAPQPAYMSDIVASARAWAFPDAYVRDLASYAPRGDDGTPEGTSTHAPRVRPRFATPFDRR